MNLKEGSTLDGLCQRVTALVCSVHDDRACRGTIRRVVRSVPASSSALAGGPGALAAGELPPLLSYQLRVTRARISEGEILVTLGQQHDFLERCETWRRRC